MAIERSDTQQTTCNAFSVDNGERRQVASATCTIRPGKSVSFSIDLPQGTVEDEYDRAAIASMFKKFMEDELKKAQDTGIPI